MNYIKHLTGFFDKVVKDRELNPTHVSLYIALFQFWNCNRFRNPISISRDEVMRISKISSKATYHKCLKNLHALGYINYEPSYNPFKGSQVFLLNLGDELKPIPKNEKNTTPINEPLFDPVNEQVPDKFCASNKTGNEQVIVPYINNKNNTNISNDLKIANLGKQAKKNEIEKEVFKNSEFQKKEKGSAEKEKEPPIPSSISSQSCHLERCREASELNPTIEKVIEYFLKQNFPELEANKFFNYFSSIGWLVGGKNPMVNWQAAAQNWILNAPKFISNEQQYNRGKHLTTTTDKDYSEPL
jgi:hypothetical protein